MLPNIYKLKLYKFTYTVQLCSVVQSQLYCYHANTLSCPQLTEGSQRAMEIYQATDFISVFQKVKLAFNLLVMNMLQVQTN